VSPRVALTTLLATGVAALAAAPGAGAATREYWVAAVPVTWNMAPNQFDDITGARLDPLQTVMGTVVYRRFTRGWRRPLPNTPTSGNQNLIPGPLVRARVGDRLLVHFRNMDFARRDPHSMHFHGVHYKPSSDGAFVPGVSGRDANVRPGQSWTYRLTAGADSVGAWPYHDHSPTMHDSIDGGMYGMLSIFGRDEPLPDREFVVVFARMGDFQTIDGRAFVGNTPVYRARPGQLVQWDVMAMGSEHHSFHVHGHRRLTPGGVSRDTQTVAPAESFRFRWREREPGTWLYHCHVEEHMALGMIGTYRVTRR
jgi:FtsP/CotA-like multicopper oxidase with cupredoxin domain